MPKVAVIVGSVSDLPAMEGCFKQLKAMGIAFAARVLSAHRTPDAAARFAKDARGEGFELIIAAAGKAAHLPGVLAAYTSLPVIGVPIKSSLMDGLDSLLSIVQMPTGVPVATVAVNGGDNAALLAARILALRHPELTDKLEAHRADMERAILESDEKHSKEIETLYI